MLGKRISCREQSWWNVLGPPDVHPGRTNVVQGQSSRFVVPDLGTWHALFHRQSAFQRAHRSASLGAGVAGAGADVSYDTVIIGGGRHGLATAYYLAKEHGVTNVAVAEKGYLGSGNIGRNTTIIRSNYLLPGNTAFYEKSMQLWEELEQDINYNAMVSQRGVLHLFHSDAARDAVARRGNAMRLNGVDAELLDRRQVRQMVPLLNLDDERFPVKGGLLQPRGGTVRHDAVAWGYARAADRRGVDLLQHCEVTGIRVTDGTVRGVETTRGFGSAKRVALACAGNSSRVAAMAGLMLPIESHVLQAFVSEGIKPIVDSGAAQMHPVHRPAGDPAWSIPYARE